jgi:signal peptidase II
MTKLKRLLLAVCIMGICIGCDQGTKRLAEHTLQDASPIHLAGGAFRLIYAENPGAWGSLGASWPDWARMLLLAAIPVVVLTLLAVHVWRRQSLTKLELVAYSLFIGGGVGNVIDRIAYGHVVDFMYLGVGSIGTNIFNVADIAIVAGAALIVIASHRKQPQPVPAAA